jgi:hypothetical protein
LRSPELVIYNNHSIAEVAPIARSRNESATSVLAKEQSGRLLPACRKKIDAVLTPQQREQLRKYWGTH